MPIENGEIVEIEAGGVRITDTDGNPIEREPEEVTWDADAAEKGGYETFMLKEIHEQADAVAETIADRLPGDDGVDLSDVELDDDFLRDVRRIVIVACGTSYHAGLIGRYAIEEWARVPVEMDIASEYRYRNPVVGPGDLVIGITQSGETADTLAAMRLAREAGATVLAVTNIMGSQATRDADAVLYTRAGLEIGVAATKTFVAQVAAMYLLGLRIAELRGTLPPERIAELVAELKALPSKIEETLAAVEEPVRAVAAAHSEQNFFLYLGRHIGLPVCLEGALKLKEISYIPTDAYAAGEMKHGPIALLDESTPVVCVATDSPVLEKVLSNVEEVRARGAQTIAIATAGDERAAEVADETIEVAAHRLDPAADRGDPAAAAARLRHRPRPRPQRRPAAQPGEDRHGRVRAARMRARVKARLVLSSSAALAALAVAGCGGGSSSGSDPATLAPPRSPLFIEATVQPQGELKSNIESLAKNIAGIDDLGGLIVSELEDSASSSGEELDFEKEIEPWLGEKGGIFFQEYDGDDFNGYGVAIQTTDPGATQDFIDKQSQVKRRTGQGRLLRRRRLQGPGRRRDHDRRRRRLPRHRRRRSDLQGHGRRLRAANRWPTKTASRARSPPRRAAASPTSSSTSAA